MQNINELNNVSNYLIESTSLTCNKIEIIWVDKNNKLSLRPDEIKFSLYDDNSSIEKNIILNSENDWKIEFNENININDIKISINNYETTYLCEDNELIITNTFINSKIKYFLHINWFDCENKKKTRPNNVTIQLKQNDQIIDELTLKNDEFTYEWENLYKYDSELNLINYTINENLIENYDISYNQDNEYKCTITNTFIIPKLDYIVKKIWNDNNSSLRPTEIVLKLLANNNEISSLLVSGENNKNEWTYTLKDLDKYDENLNEIKYNIKEPELPLNYTHSIEKTEFESIITNTLNIPKIDYTVKKIWNDFNDLLLQSFLLSSDSIELKFNLKNDNKNRNTI